MTNETTTLSELESHLWESANILRGPVDAADFKTYVFPLLFFKRISDVYDEEYAAALAESEGDEEYALFPQNYRFQIPTGCHWSNVRLVTTNVGQALQKAMRGIEKANPETLYGILDVDPRHGGDDSLTALILKHGSLPGTAQQTTGGGGKHIVFRFPDGIQLPSYLAPGIELKGDGRYIVVAPSLHKSGRRYQWDGVLGEQSLFSPAEVPAWLLDLVKTKGAKHRTNGSEDGEPFREGQRSCGLASLAGAMRRKGMAPRSIRAALLEENKARCVPPLPDAEVLKIGESISRYSAGESSPGLIRDERPFTKVHWPDPLEPAAFHGIAGEFVRLVSPHTEADPAALLVQFLLEFGNAIGRGPHFKVGPDRH